VALDERGVDVEDPRSYSVEPRDNHNERNVPPERGTLTDRRLLRVHGVTHRYIRVIRVIRVIRDRCSHL